LHISNQHTALYSTIGGNCALALSASVLQHTATHCNRLQHAATRCNTLQHTATHCNALQHTATHCNTLYSTATRCNTLHTLQRTAIHCNTLQHVANVKRMYTRSALSDDWRDLHSLSMRTRVTISREALLVWQRRRRMRKKMCVEITGAHCNILQHIATRYNTLQHATTRCDTLKHTATHCKHCNTLQHNATHCTTLQHIAPHQCTNSSSSLYREFLTIQLTNKFTISKIQYS